MKNFYLDIAVDYENNTRIDKLFNVGVTYRIDIGSGYVVSVIKKPGSYGYEDDLWEVAILKDDELVNLEGEFDLMDDVIGYLNEKEVNNWIERFHKKYVESP